MQQERPGQRRLRGVLIVLVVLLILGAAIYFLTQSSSGKAGNKVTATLLPCPYSDTVSPFGKYVLYYDGLKIHCINESGAVRWSFQLGEGGGYSCSDTMIAAWSGNNLYIIDQNGNATYNDNLGSEVQFARVGSRYVAAVVGDTTSPRLLVKDHTGAHMDEESDAYSTMILLDVGFFGSSGQYMWTLALDVFGTASNTVLNTFEVGKMSTGMVSLGEPITYQVLYDNGVLRVINTRKMRTFSERGTEDTSQSMLVYGWRYLDHEQPTRGYAQILFAPTTQTGSMYDIRELRTISGTTDKRYTLPDSCLGALIWNKYVYAISSSTLYRASTSENQFTSFTLPMETAVTRYIGKLSDGSILVACNDQVYVLGLPLATRQAK